MKGELVRSIGGLLIGLIVVLFSTGHAQNYSYTERLDLRPLPRNTLLTTFSFESISSSDSNSHEYALFPRSLGQIIEQSRTHELHLRFSQGWWDAENWGSPPELGQYAGGIGVVLWAWVEGVDLEEAKANWRKLVYTLSGLFCASLNFIDEAQTTFPVKSFKPFGDIDSHNKGLYLLRGALPREPVCTENLTPFVKLLPCKGKAGISSLLDGHKIFDAQWQGMAIDVWPICSGVSCRFKMTQTINAVIDVPRALGRKVSPVPQPEPFEELRCDTFKSYHSPYHCFPLGESTEVDWLLSDIFGRKIQGSCPLAENDIQVSVAVPEGWKTSISAQIDEANFFRIDSREFKLEKNLESDIQLSSSNSSDVVGLVEPPVLVERSFTGYGQERGGLRTVFTNPSLESSVRFVYFETLPWYMRLYLHTLEINVRYSSVHSLTTPEVLKDILYLPALDRKQPSQLEIEIYLPPETSASLSYDFDKSLLYIEEYPPDANHGFDIAPGVLTTLDAPFFTARTTSLLLSLPTPDFSMPYNVIILTGTVMALTFGSIFNSLTKKVVPEEEAEALAREKPINKLVDKVGGRLKSVLERKFDTTLKEYPHPEEESEPSSTG
jgi:phosphatidylinositol glycan class T